MIIGRTRTNARIPGAMYDLHIWPKRIMVSWLEGENLLNSLSGVVSSLEMVATAALHILLWL